MEDLGIQENKYTVESIANEIASLVAVKDANYNHAFDESCDRFGNVYAVSKLYEKYSRIENFVINDINDSESLEDSLMDIVGYSLLLLRRLKNKGE